MLEDGARAGAEVEARDIADIAVWVLLSSVKTLGGPFASSSSLLRGRLPHRLWGACGPAIILIERIRFILLNGLADPLDLELLEL